jgi:hypothetical protein
MKRQAMKQPPRASGRLPLGIHDRCVLAQGRHFCRPLRHVLILMICLSVIGGISTTNCRAAVFLDLTAVIPGGPGVGGFTGTLGATTVTGGLPSGPPPAFSLNVAGPGIGGSTLDGSSSQFSHLAVFSPTAPSTDRVGFTYLGVASGAITISFSSPVTDPVFHFASLNWTAFSFAPTPGFSSLTLLEGNDGIDGDGIDPAFGGLPYSSALVWDLTPPTLDATPPGTPPPTAGARSAYGSVRLNGTFSSVVMVVDSMGPFADDGSFTISIPEPGIPPIMAVCAALYALCYRKRFLRGLS